MVMPMFEGFETNEYRKGLNEGFKVAESYIKEASKRFYKEIKGGLIDRMATCHTISTCPEEAEILGLLVKIDKNVPEGELLVNSKKELLKLKILADFEQK